MMIFLLALGLAMDAFAVSVSCGMTVTNKNRNRLALLAIIFGIYQAGMFAAGWILGDSAKFVIESYDHVIALILLVYIGSKMIKEAFEEKECKLDMLSLKMLMILGFATSIDALAAGIGFASVSTNIIKDASIVGAVTLVMCFVGGYLVSKLVSKINISKYVEILGGVILIGIGFKIFIEHMWG